MVRAVTSATPIVDFQRAGRTQPELDGGQTATAIDLLLRFTCAGAPARVRSAGGRVCIDLYSTLMHESYSDDVGVPAQ